MKELTIEEKAKAYDEALERAEKALEVLGTDKCEGARQIFSLFPELKESEDERIRKAIHIYLDWLDGHKDYQPKGDYTIKDMIAWLEKQGKAEPKWCHHKVDLSGCSEEYRKAYYDGWNNCNQQHSQCKSEENDVVKCLINGMKFYYEGNEEATWGTEKFSMKVKDILAWLEKQGESYTKKDVDDAYIEGMACAKNELEKQSEQKSTWSEEDEKMIRGLIVICDEWTTRHSFYPIENCEIEKLKNWLESLKERIGG